MKNTLLASLLFFLIPMNLLAESWQHKQCSRSSIREARAFLHQYEEQVNAMRAYLESCDAKPRPHEDGGIQECAVYFSARNLYPSTVSSLCEGINRQQFQCMKDLVDRNHYPTTARDICKRENLNYNCLNFMIQRNQYPSTAADLCTGLNEPQFECTRDLIQRNHYPTTARDTCAHVTRAGLECMRLVLDARQYPSVAKQVCTDVSRAKLDCITPMLRRGVAATSAQQLCARVP